MYLLISAPQGEDPDIALEGMEKYLMNKLYKSCFLPAASDDGPTDLALAERLSLMSFVQAQVQQWVLSAVMCIGVVQPTCPHFNLLLHLIIRLTQC